jgi:hypothetical protein
MTPIIWANILLVIPFILVWVGVPLWMTVKHQDAVPDFSEAHAYLAAKQRQLGVAGVGRRQDTAGQLESLVAA